MKCDRRLRQKTRKCATKLKKKKIKETNVKTNIIWTCYWQGYSNDRWVQKCPTNNQTEGTLYWENKSRIK